MIKRTIALGVALVMMFSLSACTKSEPIGYFYSLEEAYEKGWVSQDDLKTMAFIHREKNEYLSVYYENMDEALNGGVSAFDNFIPIQKISETLSIDIEEKIRNAYVEDLRILPEYSDASIEDVTVYGYCGTYNDYIAVMLTDSYHTYNGYIEFGFVQKTLNKNAEALFICLNATPAATNQFGIFIWKNGQTEEFYDLQTAYVQDLLSENDMLNISYYQRQIYIKSWSQNFISTSKSMEILNTKTEKKIKQTLLNLTKASRPEAKIDEMNVGEYLGTYNGYIVLSNGGWAMSRHIVIGDVLFMFPSIGFLKVWKENLG